MHIVLIDRDDPSRDMLSRRLMRRGYRVTTAADGAAGVAAVRSEPTDLVVLDATEPGPAGWEAARELKADPALQDLPIIATTSYAQPGDREDAQEAGCLAYEVKSIEFNRLARTIERIIGPGSK
jgi:CheY-like chemotaxis protein